MGNSNIFWGSNNGRSGSHNGSTVDFNINKNLSSDSVQIVLTRMLDKGHPALFGPQDAFEAYVRVSARYTARDGSAWEDRKADLELWEIQDITPSNKVAKMDLSDAPLKKRDQEYLRRYLAGEINDAICSDLGISPRTGDRIRLGTVKTLKAWTKYDGAKALHQADMTCLHGSDISDLRYRKVYSRDHAENQRIKANADEPTFCSLYPTCPLVPPLPDCQLPDYPLRATDAERMRVNAR